MISGEQINKALIRLWGLYFFENVNGQMITDDNEGQQDQWHTMLESQITQTGHPLSISD